MKKHRVHLWACVWECVYGFETHPSALHTIPSPSFWTCMTHAHRTEEGSNRRHRAWRVGLLAFRAGRTIP